MAELILSFLFLVLGLLIGALSTWMVAKYRFALASGQTVDFERKYVTRELHEALLQQQVQLREDLKSKEEDRLALEKSLAAKERDLLYLEEKLQRWQEDFSQMQQQAHLKFEQIAGKLLEEKSRTFTDQNHRNINELLQPLRERIREFSQDIERRFSEESREKTSLKKEIDLLRDLNRQLGEDARNLTAALKGDAKIQGNWGELQLELLLEKAGLAKGAHFVLQASFKDEAGQDKRPDCIVHLPESKHLVIDSKVSLKAFERYHHSDTAESRQVHLKDHLASIRNHLKELSGKNYQQLHQINTPDYLLMFIPLEPAFTIAIQHDPGLFLEALDKNIVIVTNSTLLATLRTVAFIWRQDKQKRNVLEIARQSGLLYDKFVGFVEDLRDLGVKLDQAQGAWQGAINKLSDSRKSGDTLIGRAQRIRELGARTTKSLPAEFYGEEEAPGPDDPVS
jgi:DNA recombination protein RmuC